jgi:hypothetical protein
MAGFEVSINGRFWVSTEGLKSNASGGIVWGSNKGTYVKFANEGGIIAFLRPECLSKSS